MVDFNRLNPIFGARISAAIRDAEKATGEKANPREGYRDVATQAKYYRAYKAGTGPIAAPPGKSLHQQGMALDLGPGKVRDWIQAHAKQYGLEAATARDRAHGSWSHDPPHVQLARGVLKTPYDATPVAYTGGPPRAPAQQAAADLVAGRIPGGPPTLRRGATDAETGGAVTRLQRQLADAGINPGPVDGKYGRQTAAAVRQAEKQFNLPTRDRGVAGPQVQGALASHAGGVPGGGQFIGGNGVAPPAGVDRGNPLFSPIPIAQNPLQGSSPDFSIADPGPPGQRLQAGGGVVTIPTGTGGGAVAGAGGPMGWPGAGQPLADPPSQVVMTPHSLNSGVARGAPVPAPPVAPGGVPVASDAGGGYPYPTGTGRSYGTDERGISELMLGRARTSPDSFATNAWPENRPGAVAGGPSYDTIYSLNSRIDPNMGSGQDASGQAIHAALPGAVERAAAAKTASMSYPSMIAGRPDYPAPNSPSNSTGINGVLAGISGIPGAIFGPGGPIWNASEAVNGWLGGGSEPAAAKPGVDLYKSVPPAVPGPQSSIGGYPQYAGGPSLESLPSVTSFDRMFDGPPVGPQDNIGDRSRPANQPVAFPLTPPMGVSSDYGTGIPRDSSSSDYGALPARFNAPGYQPFPSGGKPSVYASVGDFSSSGGTDTLVGGAGAGADRLSSAGGRLVPTSVIHGPASGDFNLGNGGPASGGFAPVGDPANPGVVPAGDPAPPPAAVDSTGLSLDDTGYPDTGAGQPARVAARGAIGPVSYVKPQTLAQRAGGAGLRVAASAVGGPPFGMLLGAIYNSAMRHGGSFDNARQYTGGTVTPYNRTGTSPWGSALYTTPSGSQSASMFTPTAAGWQAPNFSPVSGGPLYATNPLTHTYIDSHGNEHPY